MDGRGKCSGITTDGGRCKGIAITGSAYCHAHHPDRAEARSRAARRAGKNGGRGRPREGSAELVEIKSRIREVIDAVLDGTTERASGAIALQGYNVLIRAYETQRRQHDADALDARLD